MIYRGTYFPDVPDEAPVVVARGVKLITATPFVKTFLFRNAEFGGGGPAYLFRGFDFEGVFSEDVDWEARILAFGIGIHVTEANAGAQGAVHCTVELFDTDELGVVVGAAVAELQDRMFYGNGDGLGGTGGNYSVESYRGQPTEPRLFPNPAVPKGLTLKRQSMVKVSVRAEGGTPVAVPVNTECTCELVLALYPRLTPEQFGAGS